MQPASRTWAVISWIALAWMLANHAMFLYTPVWARWAHSSGSGVDWSGLTFEPFPLLTSLAEAGAWLLLVFGGLGLVISLWWREGDSISVVASRSRAPFLVVICSAIAVITWSFLPYDDVYGRFGGAAEFHASAPLSVAIVALDVFLASIVLLMARRTVSQLATHDS